MATRFTVSRPSFYLFISLLGLLDCSVMERYSLAGFCLQLCTTNLTSLVCQTGFCRLKKTNNNNEKQLHDLPRQQLHVLQPLLVMTSGQKNKGSPPHVIHLCHFFFFFSFEAKRKSSGERTVLSLSAPQTRLSLYLHLAYFYGGVFGVVTSHSACWRAALL